MSVLIVEEDEILRELIKTYIQCDKNQEVEAVQGVENALHVLKKQPDILIVEYGIVGEVCENIIEEARKLYNPFIVITTTLQHIDFLWIKLKPDRIIQKPFNLIDIDRIFLELVIIN